MTAFEGLQIITGWTLIHTLWQAAIVAAATAILLHILRRASSEIRYAVSCAGLFVMTALAIGTLWTLYQQVDSITSATVVIKRLSETSFNPARIIPYLAIGWILSVTFLSFRLLGGWLSLRRWSNRAQPAGDVWERTLASLEVRMGIAKAIRIVASARIEVPFVAGILKPVIVVPAAALTGLGTGQIEMILAHELAHIRRHDFLVNLLQTIVDTLFFYNPAVRWLSNQVRIEREHCCDDTAVAICGDRVEYARALTALEGLRVALHPAVAANGGSLRDRVRRLITSESSRGHFSGAEAVLTLLALSIALLVVPFTVRASSHPAPHPTAAPHTQISEAPDPVGTEIEIRAGVVIETEGVAPAASPEAVVVEHFENTAPARRTNAPAARVSRSKRFHGAVPPEPPSAPEPPSPPPALEPGDLPCPPGAPALEAPLALMAPLSRVSPRAIHPPVAPRGPRPPREPRERATLAPRAPRSAVSPAPIPAFAPRAPVVPEAPLAPMAIPTPPTPVPPPVPELDDDII